MDYLADERVSLLSFERGGGSAGLRPGNGFADLRLEIGDFRLPRCRTGGRLSHYWYYFTFRLRCPCADQNHELPL